MVSDLTPTSVLEAEHVRILYYDFDNYTRASYSSKTI